MACMCGDVYTYIYHRGARAKNTNLDLNISQAKKSSFCEKVTRKYIFPVKNWSYQLLVFTRSLIIMKCLFFVFKIFLETQCVTYRSLGVLLHMFREYNRKYPSAVTVTLLMWPWQNAKNNLLCKKMTNKSLEQGKIAHSNNVS